MSNASYHPKVHAMGKHHRALCGRRKVALASTKSEVNCDRCLKFMGEPPPPNTQAPSLSDSTSSREGAESTYSSITESSPNLSRYHILYTITSQYSISILAHNAIEARALMTGALIDGADINSRVVEEEDKLREHIEFDSIVNRTKETLQ